MNQNRKKKIQDTQLIHKSSSSNRLPRNGKFEIDNSYPIPIPNESECSPELHQRAIEMER